MNKFEKPHMPEYPEDFGHKVEEMFSELFESKEIFEKMEKASDFDDKVSREGRFDRLAIKDGKPFLAIQQKFSESQERQKEAVDLILKSPLVQVHDNEGNVIFKEKIPLVLVHDKLGDWGKAFSKYLENKLDSVIEALDNQQIKLRTFLEQMIACLKTEKYYFPQHAQIFDERIFYLEDKLKNI